MSLWQLVPAADPNDARWRGQPIWGDIIVRAANQAEALSVADALLSDPSAGDEANVRPARDLFQLRQIPPSEDPGESEGTILRVRLRGRP